MRHSRRPGRREATLPAAWIEQHELRNRSSSSALILEVPIKHTRRELRFGLRCKRHPLWPLIKVLPPPNPSYAPPTQAPRGALKKTPLEEDHMSVDPRNSSLVLPRRGLLKGAAAAGGALLLPGTLRAAEPRRGGTLRVSMTYNPAA